MSASDTSSSTTTDQAETEQQSENKDASVTEASHQARERLEQQYREIEQTYDDTRARIEEFNERAADFIRENPAICIVGAAATGYLIGRLASRRWLT